MRRRCRSTSAWSKPGFAPGGIAMKPTLARLTSGAFAGACHLVLAPGVERVVDRQRQLVELVLLEQHLERAEPVAVRVLRVFRIVGVGALTLPNLEHLLGRHVEELRLGIDEVLDQPGAGDPVGLRSFSCNPLHGRSPLLLVECKAGGSGLMIPNVAP